MPEILSVPITPPRVPFIDSRTGNVSREWYMFFLSLFDVTGDSELSVDDLQKGPPSLTIDDINALVDAAFTNVSSFNPALAEQIAELRKQLDGSALSSDALVDRIIELQKQIQALQVVPPPREFKRARYGQFLDTTTQVAAAINTAYAITFNTTDVTNGVYLGSPSSRVYVDEDSIYNFTVSIQVDKTSGGTANFWIWPSINGTDVPNSASQLRIQGNDAEIFTSVSFFLDLAAGDYVEWKFAVSDTSVELATFPATAFYPAIPSIILTVTDNIQGVQ